MHIYIHRLRTYGLTNVRAWVCACVGACVDLVIDLAICENSFKMKNYDMHYLEYYFQIICVSFKPLGFIILKLNLTYTHTHTDTHTHTHTHTHTKPAQKKLGYNYCTGKYYLIQSQPAHFYIGWEFVLPVHVRFVTK